MNAEAIKQQLVALAIEQGAEPEEAAQLAEGYLLFVRALGREAMRQLEEEQRHAPRLAVAKRAG